MCEHMYTAHNTRHDASRHVTALQDDGSFCVKKVSGQASANGVLVGDRMEAVQMVPIPEDATMESLVAHIMVRERERERERERARRGSCARM